MMGRSKPMADVVNELLEMQKTALLQGDVEKLGQIETPLQRAFDKLKGAGVSEQTLLRIKETAGYNARLLKAAQAGIATARAQITEQGSQELFTYDALGQSRPTTVGGSRLLARR